MNLESQSNNPERIESWKKQFEREISQFKAEFEKNRQSGDKFAEVENALNSLSQRTDEINSNEIYLMLMSELHLLENRFREAFKETQTSLSELKQKIGNGKKTKTMLAQGEVSPEVYKQVAEVGRTEASNNATAGAKDFFGEGSWIARLIRKSEQV